MIDLSLRSLLGGCIILALLPLAARSQGSISLPEGPARNLAADIKSGLEEANDPTPRRPAFADGAERPRKSVALAGALSAVLPGAGQVYAEAPWWRAALYGTVEAAGWALYAVYNAKGNRATEDFQNFADAHWDVTRYVDWIGSNYQDWSSLDVDKNAAAEALAAIYVSSDPSLRPWDRINFEQLNKLERAVHGGFSHTLPKHGDQQYYEEIGKYFQYRAGWDDHPVDGDTVIFNPSAVSPRNHDYVAQRENANALGGYAVTALGVVVLNHLVSLVDAALEARGYNLSLHGETHGMLLPDGSSTLVTGIGMEIRF